MANYNNKMLYSRVGSTIRRRADRQILDQAGGATFTNMRNVSPNQAGFQNFSSGCCPGQNSGVFLVSPGTCAGTIPPYASTIVYDNAGFQNGPIISASQIALSQEIDSITPTRSAGAFNVALNQWEVSIRAAGAGDPLVGQSVSFVGLKITSSDTQRLITDLDINLLFGDTENLAGMTNAGSWDYLTKRDSALQNLYLIAPLLSVEPGSQRVRLVSQQFGFVAGPPAVAQGITWTVADLPNDPAFSVQAFTLTRSVKAAVGYAASLGV